jgi:DNA invertase Pin-like site-specific DNA recombinase
MSTYLVYLRQSYRRDSDAEVSEEQQEAAARRLLPAGATAEVIRDTGGHNSGATANRDGYQTMLRRIDDPDVAGIAVYDLSRLARNVRLMLELKAELDRRNLHLIVSNLPDTRFDTAIGRFLFGQLALAAQLQRDLDSERMVGLTRTKAESGGHNGLPPFGYRAARDASGQLARPHRLEIIEVEAELVREIFDRYPRPETRSTGYLAAQLNAEGKRRRVRARDASGAVADVDRPWTEKGVADVLRRAPFYLGQVVYHRGAATYAGAHPPIITPEQAHAVDQAKVRRHRPGRPDVQHRTYVLQAIAYCECGLRMRGETMVRAASGSRGPREHRYYRCPGRRDGRCNAPHCPAGAVEQAVVAHLAAHATPRGLVDAMRDELRVLRHVPDAGIRNRRAGLEAAAKRLRDAFVWGHVPEAEYHAERRKIETQLAELPLPTDSNVIAFDLAADRLLPFAETLLQAEASQQAGIVRHIVDRVVIADRQVRDIVPRLEAAPFFAAMQDRMAVAPPDGFEPPTPALGRLRSIH